MSGAVAPEMNHFAAVRRVLVGFFFWSHTDCYKVFFAHLRLQALINPFAFFHNVSGIRIV